MGAAVKLELPLLHALVAAAASRCHYVVVCSALNAVVSVQREASVTAVGEAAALLESLHSQVHEWASACSMWQRVASRANAAGFSPAETASLFQDALGTAAAAATLFAFRVKQLQHQGRFRALWGEFGGKADVYSTALAKETHDTMSAALSKVGESGKSVLYVSLDSGGRLALGMAEVLVNLGVLIADRPPPVRGFCIINNTGKVLKYELIRKGGEGSTATATGAVFRATPEAGAVPVNGSCSVGFTCTATAVGDHELLYSLELDDRVTAGRVNVRVTLSVCSLNVAVGVPSASGELTVPLLDFGAIVPSEVAQRSVVVFNPLSIPLKMKVVVQPVSGYSGRFGLDRAVDQVGTPARANFYVANRCACCRTRALFG
jgi:hypothetical protein